MHDVKSDLRRLSESYGEPRFGIDELRTRRDRAPAMHRRSRARIVAGGVVLALIVAVALPAILPFGGPGGPDPAAAALFHRFARIARHAPAEPAPEPGQFVFTKTREEQSTRFLAGDGVTTFDYAVSSTRERWLGTDGSGRDVTTVGPAVFASPGDRAAYDAWVAAVGSAKDLDLGLEAGGTSTERYAAGQLVFRDTSALPTDPTELRSLIEDREIVGGPDGDWETFVLATDLLRDSYASPPLRAALYEVMADLPGIEIVGRTTDASGRRGIALASTHDGIRSEVVFDERTGRILEEREIVADEQGLVGQSDGPTAWPYANIGEPLYRATYLTSAAVVGLDTAQPAD